ncbi:MAG: hypothetical protein DRN40_06815, partial [Thermoplasmata archaeon]
MIRLSPRNILDIVLAEGNYRRFFIYAFLKMGYPERPFHPFILTDDQKVFLPTPLFKHHAFRQSVLLCPPYST